MKIVFTTTGKYRHDDKVLVITSNDVEKQKIFEVKENDAKSFIKVGKAVLAEKIELEEKLTEDEGNGLNVENMTVSELKEFAELNKIDLGEATLKADILAIVEESILGAKENPKDDE